MRQKLFLLMPVALLALTSCGSNSVTGIYKFQLGNKEGTYASMEMALTNNAYVPEVTSESSSSALPSDAKELLLTFDIGGIKGLEGLSNFNLNDLFNEIEQEETSEAASSTTSELTSEGDTSSEHKPFLTLDGYYYQSKEEGSHQLYFGISILEDYQIRPEITELAIYATLDGDAINCRVPVSVKDLRLQLYWYGYRTSSLIEIFAPTDLTEENPELFKHNKPGTHPTAEDIEAFRQYELGRKERGEASVGDELFQQYRDFYTIDLGLIKQ